MLRETLTLKKDTEPEMHVDFDDSDDEMKEFTDEQKQKLKPFIDEPDITKNTI